MSNEVAGSVKEEFKKTLDWMLKQKLNDKEIKIFVEEILSADKIFLNAAGRSMLVAKAFAMRLMHLGFSVYVIGEITTPAIKKGNLYIVISGSGESRKNSTKIAIEQGAKIFVITSYLNSSLGKVADAILIVPGREKEEEIITYKERKMRREPIAPLGTLFELLCLLILDSIISYLVIEENKEEKDLKGKHAKPE